MLIKRSLLVAGLLSLFLSPAIAADSKFIENMPQLAKDAGLGRESLYKALTPGAKPRYDTMLKLLHALGVKLSASPVHSQFKPIHHQTNGVSSDPAHTSS